MRNTSGRMDKKPAAKSMSILHLNEQGGPTRNYMLSTKTAVRVKEISSSNQFFVRLRTNVFHLFNVPHLMSRFD